MQTNRIAGAAVTISLVPSGVEDSEGFGEQTWVCLKIAISATPK